MLSSSVKSQCSSSIRLVKRETYLQRRPSRKAARMSRFRLQWIGWDDVLPVSASVVVTFRPLRLGNAELRLSAVALQGAAGRAIAHESPAAFRTAIVQ